MLVNSQPVQVNRRTAGFRLPYAGQTVPLTKNCHPWTRLVTQDSRAMRGRKARTLPRFSRPAPHLIGTVILPWSPQICAPFDCALTRTFVRLQVLTGQVRCPSRHQDQRATPRSGPLCLLIDCARGSIPPGRSYPAESPIKSAIAGAGGNSTISSQ